MDAKVWYPVGGIHLGFRDGLEVPMFSGLTGLGWAYQIAKAAFVIKLDKLAKQTKLPLSAKAMQPGSCIDNQSGFLLLISLPSLPPANVSPHPGSILQAQLPARLAGCAGSCISAQLSASTSIRLPLNLKRNQKKEFK